MKKLKISAHSGIRIKNLIILVGMLMIKFVYAHFIILYVLTLSVRKRIEPVTLLEHLISKVVQINYNLTRNLS